jgi:hypothetical protein
MYREIAERGKQAGTCIKNSFTKGLFLLRPSFAKLETLISFDISLSPETQNP